MALTAGLRLPRLYDGKTVPGMTARAASLTAVGIYPANADVWPGIFIKFSVLDFHFCAVAMVTASGSFDLIVQSVVEPGIDFPNNLTGVSVLAPGVLRRFTWMTSGAVLW